MFHEFSLSVFHKFLFQLFGVVNFLKLIRYMLHRIYYLSRYLFLSVRASKSQSVLKDDKIAILAKEMLLLLHNNISTLLELLVYKNFCY